MRDRRVTLVLGPSTGGIGVHVRSLAAALAEAGARVVVAGPAATHALFRFPGELRPLSRRALADAELVHAHGIRAGAYAGALGPRGVPLAVTLHNASPRVLPQRFLVRRARVVIAASSDLAERARELGGRDVRLVPVAAPPLPPPARSRADVRAEIGVPDGRPLVLAVGRLAAQKDYPTLLAAAASGLDATVAVAGDGPLREELARRVAATAVDVRLLGRRDDVADLLGAADAFVLPSRWEARALVAQEAVRAGVPVVATRVGGLPELLGAAARWVPPGDPAALREALAAVLADPAERAALVAAGKARSAGWPTEAEALAALLDLYAELLR